MSLNNDEDFISKQIEEEGIRDLDNLRPIDHGTLAKPHTPVYKMHRYFARRPYSVFYELIKHYSTPRSIVLDPFCGGGVTVIECLRLRRKIIGVDLNPLATFVTEMESMDVNLSKLEDTFKKIKSNIQSEITNLYLSKCPKCKRLTPFHWMKWSHVYQCPNCKKNVIIKDSEKKGSGRFYCSSCKKLFEPIKAKKIDEVPFEIEVRCSCGYKGVKSPDKDDLRVIRKIDRKFDRVLEERNLWYPKDEFPDADRQRDDAVYQKGIKAFADFFTKRNLLALSILFKEIKKFSKTNEGLLNLLSFSDTLGWTSKMSSEPGHGWQHHAYWLPYIFYECNVWDYFDRRFKVMLKGKEFSKREINGFYKKAENFNRLKDKTCLLLTQSAHELPIPTNQIDVIITDPPYGGNVQYIELSLFYLVWLKEILKLELYKDWMLEAVETRHTGFPTEKSPEHYRDVLLKIFVECYRVLKPNGWLVMTFHNKDFAVWNSLHLAAHDAGFNLSEEDGMIYQPPIQNYTQTLHTRTSGSMLGDFILSFHKAEKKPETRLIQEVEIGNKVRKIAGETIEYHGGAKLSTIYMRLVPVLLNNGLLHKFRESDITPFLKKDFVEKDGKWFFRENIDEKGEVKPIDYVPVEARIEYLLRSLLYEKKKATMDEILEAVFTNLINSDAAEYEEISRVLNRIAEKKDERNWQLKEMGSEAQKQLVGFIEEPEKQKAAQKTLTGEELAKEESMHDLMIKQLVVLGEKEGYSSHIGQTEQRKYVEFRKLSVPMGNNVQYGLSTQAFDIIAEIDLLWLKGNTIVASFEIEKSTTIDSGINRFRNLFAVTPNLNVQAYIVIPDSREKEAMGKIGSPANRKDNLHKKIKYLLFSSIKNRKDVKVNEQTKEVT